MNKMIAAALCALAIGAAANLRADTQIFADTFNDETGTGSAGTGTAKVTIDLDTMMMRVEATFSGLGSNTTNAHIHCCTAASGSGNAGVATPTPTFPGFPSGVTSGNYDHTLDMSQAASYNGAFLTANGGTPASAFSALLSGLSQRKAYFNIHTTVNGGGEIRAILARVPEPASLMLVMVGAASGALARRRRS